MWFKKEAARMTCRSKGLHINIDTAFVSGLGVNGTAILNRDTYVS